MPDCLFKIAAAEGIGVKFAYLPAPLLGLYDSRPGEQPMILLHEKTRKSRKLLRCILAEELGHHFTCARNMMAFAQTDRIVYNKYDKLALRWAANYLVPRHLLYRAVLAGHRSIHELAEHFDVTEEFIGTCSWIYNRG
jgi:Zn-dependent peptidase ImmA (M78 family)